MGNQKNDIAEVEVLSNLASEFEEKVSAFVSEHKTLSWQMSILQSRISDAILEAIEEGESEKAKLLLALSTKLHFSFYEACWRVSN